MKKLLLILACLVLLTSASFADSFEINVLYSMAGDMSGTWAGVNVVDKDPGGLGIGMSYFASISEIVELGGGAVFFLPRKITKTVVDGTTYKITTDAIINYYPVFARLRITPRTEGRVQLYFGGDLRYGIVNLAGEYFEATIARGGLGFGFFGGILFANDLSVELGYIMQYGSQDIGGIPGDYSEGTLYLQGSYKIGL